MASTDGNNVTMETDELKISIFDSWVVHFEGTRAQLENEGLVPKNETWPERSIRCNWTCDGFHYMLRRRRPGGLKVTAGVWHTLDNWVLIRIRQGERDRRQEAIDAKLMEVERVKAKHTEAGRAAFRRYCEAMDDAEFQAFKRLTPGLVPAKRGRKPKQANTNTSQG